ncbi:MAG: HpcH/HpaI aldolase family protein [Chitinophagales bacterium]
MRENRVKRILKEGGTVIGTMISEVRGPGVMKMLATAGFDYVYIDMEHSTYSMETVGDMILSAHGTPLMTFVRVPGYENRCSLSRPLDAGADGLLCPQTESVEQVEFIIRETKYYPMGQRGAALRRGHSAFANVKFGEYAGHANAETMVILQIESEQGVRDIEKLMAIDGVDAAFIGPADLSQSYGIPGQAKDPRIVDAIHQVLEGCKKHGKACGIHLYNLDDVKYWSEQGMRLLCYNNDIAMITDTGSKNVADIKAIVGK